MDRFEELIERVRAGKGSDVPPMPRYQCHKKVWALKIKSIDLYGLRRGGVITSEDAGYGPFEVNVEYIMKHKPEVGGYFVVYEDGYKSFSPAQAFENGYTRIS